MDSTETAFFPNSTFTSVFAKENNLDKQGFTAWFFFPGMEFGAPKTWWGDQKMRPRPHEGVDLLFYRGLDEKIFSINAGAKIPVIYDGKVLKIIDDFLGKTIVVEHSFPETDRGFFLTLYGHTNPVNSIVAGQHVKAGEIVATLAPMRGEKAPEPHLHLTLAWSHRPIMRDSLDWTSIGNLDIFRLVDPRRIIAA